MILISHRGNTNGKQVSLENQPNYVDTAIKQGYNVEVDVWCINNNLNEFKIYLGHDSPDHEVSLEWFVQRIDNLWLHCKNVECLFFFKKCGYNFNYFWHENDTVTLTSYNYIWAFPGKQPIPESICVMPEIYNDNISHCIGICSDVINNYK